MCQRKGKTEFVENKDIELDEDTTGIIIGHFTAMESELFHYFPECGDIAFTLLRNPFIVTPHTVPDNNDEALDQCFPIFTNLTPPYRLNTFRTPLILY